MHNNFSTSLIVLLLLFLILTTNACGQNKQVEPQANRKQSTQKNKKYLYYLHGRIVEDLGADNAVSERFGKYEYKEILKTFKEKGIRTSIFVDANTKMVEGAAETGTDRIELYTESYAKAFHEGQKQEGIKPFISAATIANKLELGINAGHDLNLENLNFFYKSIPNLLEVSIGHALISDALYFGLETTIQKYLKELGQ